MGIRRLLTPLAVALLVGAAAVAVAQETTQPIPAAIGDLATLEHVEIRDGAGQVVLAGNFVTVTEPDGDVERKAALAPASGGTAVGEAEIDLPSAGGTDGRELEVSVDGLAASTQYRLFVDGTEIASFTTDAEGDAELEFGDAQ